MKVKDSPVHECMFRINEFRFEPCVSQSIPEELWDLLDELDNILGRPFDLEAEVS